MIGLSLNSCVDLVEEITINDDLSGHYEMRLETGALGGFGAFLNTSTYAQIPEIRDLDRTLEKLKKQEGISHVHKILNVKDLKFYIGFDFENEETLNNAIFGLANMKPNLFLKKFLKIRENKVVRPNLTPYIRKIIKDKNLMEQLPSDDLLSYVNYVLIINTPKEIQKVSGGNTQIQSNLHRFVGSFNIKNIVVSKKSIRTKIRM